jgi:predicted ArsR family transcriptional regulator
MREATLVDQPTFQMGTRRREVLARLRESSVALSVTDIAGLTGLHPNTARFHLDGLVEDGLAGRTTEERETPGRRRILYVASAEGAGPRSYRLLAEILTGLVASVDGAHEVSLVAGRAWGRHLVDRPAPSERIDADESVARVQNVFDEMGFQSETQTQGGMTEMRLRHCPFREVAARHNDVVCAIHLGILEGALGELRGPLEVEGLDPFVTPNLCVARLRHPSAA